MFKRTHFVLLLTLFTLGSAYVTHAQITEALGGFTPYSLFGPGERVRSGTVFNRSMAGVGTGIRNNRFINYLNPAAIAADTLSFMFDFGVKQDDIYGSDGTRHSAYNLFNMSHILMNFPVYKTLALQLGIAPYSNVGYKFELQEPRPEYIAELGDLRYRYYGKGSINQGFIGLGLKFLKHFSVGAEAIYYFGDIERNANAYITANADYAPLLTGYDYLINSFGGRFGLQVFGRMGKNLRYTLGASYQLAADMRGDLTRFAYASHGTTIDTAYYSVSDGCALSLPAEIKTGFSLRKGEKWLVAFDYEYANWKDVKYTAMPGVNFSPSVSNAYRVGLEYTPDRYSIRYFLRRITYRAGVYREKSYISLNGVPVNTTGITFGFSVPVFRYYNSIGFSVDLGQRGSMKNGLIRERYIMFMLDFSLHELWFIKQRYD